MISRRSHGLLYELSKKYSDVINGRRTQVDGQMDGHGQTQMGTGRHGQTDTELKMDGIFLINFNRIIL